MSKAERQLEDFEKVFKALAHASRRNILVVLKTREKMTAGEIVERFTHKWPTITRHLKQLEGAGLVQVKKVSREQYYSLNTERLTGVVNEWLKWF